MTVNLDAMIQREDFEMGDALSGEFRKPGNELYLSSLTEDGRLAAFRKPEFQRETSAWTPEIVSDFIRSVVDASVVPAVIMWQSPSGKLFVIDGAHRLSALIAWIEDDYGDREISSQFFDYRDDPIRIEAARKTRELVNTKVGTYEALRSYARTPNKAPDEKSAKWGANIANFPIYLQWISGDAKAAEESYVKINSTAVAIDNTERVLIANRHKATGIAARALLHSGTGYPYWGNFSDTTRDKIKLLASDISTRVLKPIAEFPHIALNIPIADRGLSAESVKSIHELVEYINPPKTQKRKNIEPDDTDGQSTIACLEKIKSATSRVFTKEDPGSLALHPGVYCFGPTGKFIPKAFYGTIRFVNDLEERDRFYRFTKYRKGFEEFLVRHKYYLSQISGGYGSGGRRGFSAVARFLNHVFDSVADGMDDRAIVKSFSKDTSFARLYVPQEELDGSRKFSKEASAAALFDKTMQHELRCSVCGSRLYRRAMSRDHKERFADGGPSSPSNLDFTHPYCNTGFKEKQASLRRKGSHEAETRR